MHSIAQQRSSHQAQPINTPRPSNTEHPPRTQQCTAQPSNTPAQTSNTHTHTHAHPAAHALTSRRLCPTIFAKGFKVGLRLGLCRGAVTEIGGSLCWVLRGPVRVELWLCEFCCEAVRLRGGHHKWPACDRRPHVMHDMRISESTCDASRARFLVSGLVRSQGIWSVGHHKCSGRCSCYT
jgi:hypothetical protein